MSEGRIQRESVVKKALNTFKDYQNVEENYDDLSIYNITPYFHVKIYKVDDFQYDELIEVSNNETIKFEVSEELNSVIILTKEITRPKWITTDQLTNVEHNLFIIFYDIKTNLLFINSSIKTTTFYDHIVKIFTSTKPTRIPESQINKVLPEIQDTEFFSIGLANRMGNSGETYKTSSRSQRTKCFK